MPCRPSRTRWPDILLAGCLACLTGCTLGHSELQKSLLKDHTPAAHTRNPETRYLVRCPDVLEIRITGHPGWTGTRPVGSDGRIHLDSSLRILVDGLCTPEIRQSITEATGLPVQQVSVQVADYRSQQISLFGGIQGQERAIPYRGPETVLDLLQRAGGIAPGTEVSRIFVVRPHVADGKPPEVFTIDLRAIVFAHDQQTNIRLEPSDQVYIGQTSGEHLRCCLPSWMRSLGKIGPEETPTTGGIGGKAKP
jgi:protein involved in polysaccharide export with SLBB domain